MSYQCKLIQDLLPLYHDGVCSDESREIIEEHLTNCAECSGILKEIRSAESVDIPVENSRGDQMADSLKKIKRRILRKQIIIAAAALFTAAVLFGVWLFALSGVQTAKTENISVRMINGELVCRLRGGFPNGTYIKNVEVSPDKYYMFFTIYETKRDRLVMSNSEYRELFLAYRGSNAQQIERVYYYQDNNYKDAMTGIEMLPEDELDKIIEMCTLMWSK